VSVLRKAAHVIDVLARNVAPTRLGTLAEAVQLPKSSAHRLLAELVELGLVRKVEEGSYAVGYRLVQWGHAADLALGIRQVAEPIMHELRDSSSESVHLYIVDGLHRLCVAKADGLHTLRPVIDVGESRPLGVSASGKLLLAHAGSTLYEQASRAAPESALPTWPSLETLDQIRAQGWARSTAETETGLTAIAVPVWGSAGRAIAALTLAGATTRLPDERLFGLLPDLKNSAQAITCVWTAP
jgi:IclR family transcriptional regulator, KDG regulon repressor